MGWNARLSSGVVIRQADGVRFNSLNLLDIEEMWLDGMGNLSFDKKYCRGFVEFLQYEVGRATAGSQNKIGEFIGWSDGTSEYVMGISLEKHSFHPQSCRKQKNIV